MVVLDTCAIIEACKQQPTFSKNAIKKITEGAYLLSISFAEIACKIKLGKLEIGIPIKTLYDEYINVENIQIINIGTEEWLDSIDLEWPKNRDPADRVITAYALKNRLSIITSDQKIKEFYKKTSW